MESTMNGGDNMNHVIDNSKVCSICKIGHESHILISDKENRIVWFDCGHVFIIKNGVIAKTFDYAAR